MSVNRGRSCETSCSPNFEEVSRELRFHRGARQELREAARWYEARAAGLGAEFVTEIGACLARIAERPAVFPKCAARPVSAAL